MQWPQEHRGRAEDTTGLSGHDFREDEGQGVCRKRLQLVLQEREGHRLHHVAKSSDALLVDHEKVRSKTFQSNEGMNRIHDRYFYVFN